MQGKILNQLLLLVYSGVLAPSQSCYFCPIFHQKSAQHMYGFCIGYIYVGKYKIYINVSLVILNFRYGKSRVSYRGRGEGSIPHTPRGRGYTRIIFPIPTEKVCMKPCKQLQTPNSNLSCSGALHLHLANLILRSGMT